MFVAWIVFPLVLTVVALGCGLLLESVAGVRLPGAAIPAAGLAVVVVATPFTTLSDSTAELSAPVVVALATIGLALSPPWGRGRIDPRAITAAAGGLAPHSA